METIAQTVPWDWRGAGIRFALGHHPDECCHWGVFDPVAGTIWIGPRAFFSTERLRYVVLHELAHAWQYRAAPPARLISDLRSWRFSEWIQALEAGADCIAKVWGATEHHYWDCPTDAQALVARRLAGDWT